jgi:hypothetical protein
VTKTRAGFSWFCFSLEKVVLKLNPSGISFLPNLWGRWVGDHLQEDLKTIAIKLNPSEIEFFAPKNPLYLLHWLYWVAKMGKFAKYRSLSRIRS